MVAAHFYVLGLGYITPLSERGLELLDAISLVMNDAGVVREAVVVSPRGNGVGMGMGMEMGIKDWVQSL